jgi:hypothetical protein
METTIVTLTADEILITMAALFVFVCIGTGILCQMSYHKGKLVGMAELEEASKEKKPKVGPGQLRGTHGRYTV